jgi:two-component system, NarL family, nitrate/nitrite response regulator NarL
LVPDAKLIIFTAFPSHPAIRMALAGGASGCLLKDASRVDLLETLRQVAVGDCGALSGERQAGGGLVSRVPDQVLSPQEYQVLRRVATGQTNSEIARDLFLAPTTVKTYWQSALSKLRARNRAEAVTVAYNMGIL